MRRHCARDTRTKGTSPRGVDVPSRGARRRAGLGADCKAHKTATPLNPAPTVLRATLLTNPPKAHLPGKGAPCPQHGEGGCPFKPGRVRGTHGTAGAVGVPVSRLRTAVRELHEDEVGDVPGWVLIAIHI